MTPVCVIFFFFSSRRRHTRSLRDWSSDVCSSDLKLLSGREHRVLTAVGVKLEDRLELVVSESHVRFAELSQADIEAYVASGEATDKAGGYAIQGRAQAFVTELRGSHSGVMGLPLHETVQLLRAF